MDISYDAEQAESQQVDRDDNKAVRFAKYLKLIDSDPGTCPGKNGSVCGQAMVLKGTDVGSETTIIHWASFIRECYGVVLANDRQGKIGGPELTLEIDESHIRARKYEVGRVLRSQAVWAFGSICRETRECFLVPVVRRDAATLLPLIEKNIEQGTHIISDMWRVYGLIPTQLQGYTHDAVNHSQNFVDPNNPDVDTQNAENMWGRVKANLPKNLTNEQKGAYFSKFMYEQKYKWVDLTTGQRFKLMCDHISHIYPGPFKVPWTI
ncbi:hypothetical protein B4U79_14503 [Dinothrombium tinctorium]|uniref:ISXO2-like transposase domain-containing protein n=1 Tax=Dinothrombium tinctorium TaxID=1965070 RepID=A0A443QY60_9ACAR|nr:hypothetical protein B4U79_14503 [Dinothrombium tinctorium]